MPGIGKVLALTILYEVEDIRRFKRVQQFCSYARLVKGQKVSAGKRLGTMGSKMGNRHLKWAFSEASRIQVFADDVRITGFTLKKMRIWVNGGDRVEVTGNHVSHTRTGIAVFGGSRDCIVRDNQSHNNVHGLFLTDTEDNLVEKNTFTSNSFAGIILTDAGIGDMPTHNNTLVDNNVNNNRRGLRVLNSDGNVITDCTVNSSDLSGIVLFESTGNVLIGCTANGNGFRGMLLLDSDDNEIHAGHANGNDDVGIELISSDNNTVEDSKAHGNKVCDAVDGGTGNVFSGNKFGSFNC